MASIDDGIVYAAGALVWRESRRREGTRMLHTLEVLLVHRPRYDDWSWPKGKLEAGETLPECAVREVTEETARRIILGQPLPGLEYVLEDGRTKKVHYWAARLAEDDEIPAIYARALIRTALPTEIDRTMWLPAAEAANKLSRLDDVQPLTRLVELYMQGALGTRAVIIQRHCKAVSRGSWTRAEANRPLLPEGRARAKAAMPLLSAYGVCDVVSSPWKRCLDSVKAYVLRARLDVALEPQLTESASEANPAHTIRLVEGLIRERDGLAICVHRPTLPLVVQAVLAVCPPDLVPRLPKRDPFLRTGEMLILHMVKNPAAGKSVLVQAIERQRPSV